MLSCSACRERCLQAVFGSLEPPSSIIRGSFATNRCYGTKSAQPKRSSRVAFKPQSPTVSWNQNRPFSSKYVSRTDTRRPRVPQVPDRKPRFLETGGFPISRKEHKLEQAMGNVLRKHPAYGDDPLKLAEYIQKALRGDDFETALAVTRAASKNLQCVVSWNHMIDWQLSKGKINAALKTYNEMKKRRQFPDAYTYTIIFRGCAEHKDVSAALGKVITLYYSMLSEKSTVKPNAIHMNAVLKMCARAKDMDAMFGIVAQMPSKGVTAPNSLTFTTILNALRMNSVVDSRSTLTPLQKRHNTQKAILDGRHLWQDITNRWRKGDIWIDEELVCAMGRLMLTGTTQDVDDILSLIEQAMDIPRQVPRLGTPERQAIEPASQRTREVEDPSATPEESPEEPLEALPDSPETPRVNSFEIAPVPKSSFRTSSAYAKPGRNALSLILQALYRLRLKQPATKYWDAFVNQFGVVPDIENYHSYLRILRIARASTETLRLLEQIPRWDMKIATFRIAMSCCGRDKINRNTFDNSNKILDMMISRFKIPDVAVLTHYLEVAISASVGPVSKRAEPDLATRTQGKQIFYVLDRLNPSTRNSSPLDIRSFLSYKNASELDMTEREFSEFQDGLLILTRRMITAYDLIIRRDIVTEAHRRELIQQRTSLSDFISTYARSKQLPAGEIYELPPHLFRYVNTNNLYGKMVRSQGSRSRWQAFKEELENEYKFEQQHGGRKAGRIQVDSVEAVSEVEKLAEEERKAADVAAKGFREEAMRE